MVQNLALIESSAEMDVELNVVLTPSPIPTIRNITYTAHLAALHTRYDFHVLFHVELSSTFIEPSDKKSTFFSITDTCAKSKLQHIQRERMPCSVLPIRQEIHFYF